MLGRDDQKSHNVCGCEREEVNNILLVIIYDNLNVHV